LIANISRGRSGGGEMVPWVMIPLALAAVAIGIFVVYALVFLTIRWPNVLACYWARRREQPDKLKKYKICIHAGLYTMFMASFGGVSLYSPEIFRAVAQIAGIAGGSVLAFGILSEWLVPQLTGLRLVRPPKFLLKEFGTDWSEPCGWRLFAYFFWSLIIAGLVAATSIGALSAVVGALIIALLGKPMRIQEDVWVKAERQRAAEVRHRVMRIAGRTQQAAENASQERIGEGIPDRSTSTDVTEATHLLLQGLQDRNEDVRKASAKALAENPDVNAAEALVAALKSNKGPIEVWHDAELALIKIGSSAMEPLLKLLEKRDWIAFDAACRIAGKLKDPRAVDLLIPALKDSNRSVRVEAAKALGAIGDARALEPLISALRHRDADTAESAALALGKLADPRAVEPLVAALGAVGKAAYALGQIGKPAMAAVAAASGAGKFQKRWHAIDALTEIGQCAVGKLAEIWKCDAQLRLHAGTAFIKLDPQAALAQFTESLHGTETEIRVDSVDKLGELENPVATDLLISTLGDKDAAVRRRAVHSLAQHKRSEKAKLALIEALSAEDPGVRTGAAYALGDYPLRDVAQRKSVCVLLVEKLKDKEESVRATAAKALCKIGDPAAIEPIKAARSTLGWLNRTSVDEALASLSESAENQRPPTR
jgi:HEAT repeat protein